MGACDSPSFIGTKLTASDAENSNGNDTSNDMNRRSTEKAEFAVCIDNSSHPASLELHKIYRVIDDHDAARDADIRVIDESGEDYLYPAACFSCINVSAQLRASLLSAP